LSSALPDVPDLFYRRRLPHWLPEHTDIFVTCRLFGSLPRPSAEVLAKENTSHTTFRQWNESLDRCEAGPTWLGDHRVATVVRDALLHGERTRHDYALHAWVIMPNHVHAVIQPRVPVSKIMQWIKQATARRGNQILGRTGEPFWQDESYDRWIRSDLELENAIAYVERNPVTAGLAEQPGQWPWSSASAELRSAGR
jgi:REP element-mobilizing transposase RayT